MYGRLSLMAAALIAVVMIGVSALAVGGATGSSKPTNPRAVSRTFIRAVAARDTRACSYLTPRATDELRIVSAERTCAKAVHEQTKLLDRLFSTSRPQALLANLDRGKIVRHRSELSFEFTTPAKWDIALSLDHGGGRWRIDLVSRSRVEICHGPHLEHCHPPRM
jgi:hypothetical protein